MSTTVSAATEMSFHILYFEAYKGEAPCSRVVCVRLGSGERGRWCMRLAVRIRIDDNAGRYLYGAKTPRRLTGLAGSASDRRSRVRRAHLSCRVAAVDVQGKSKRTRLCGKFSQP